MTDDDRMLRSLREAADPQPAPGAAERIAEGAWRRTAQLRAAGAGRIFTMRRAGWAAAAAVLVAASVLAWRGTDAAFAVEGDPVLVRRGGAWVPTRRVAMDAFVLVRQGGSVLRWPDGGTLRPQPDSMFHVFRSELAPSQIRIEFERGGGDVLGASFSVAVHDVTVERDPSAAKFGIWVNVDAPDGAPCVQVECGRVIVHSGASGDRLSLGVAETARMMSVAQVGAASPRLTRLRKWTAATPMQAAREGFDVVDATFGPVGGVTLVGTTKPPNGLLAYAVPPDAVPEALHRFKRVEMFRFSGSVYAGDTPPTRYVYEKDATRVEVLVDAHGTVRVDDGSGPREYPDLAAFRRDAPQLAALFGSTLDR